MSWAKAARACLARTERISGDYELSNDNQGQGHQRDSHQRDSHQRDSHQRDSHQRDGHQRWHFQHGPIDLIIGIDGEMAVIDKAIEQAWARFSNILEELAAELNLLKTALPIGPGASPKLAQATIPIESLLQGAIARRMFQCCAPYGWVDQTFVTPMAAVAGCVAQEIVDLLRAPGIRKSWVNNGGDIAWYSPADSQQKFVVGIPVTFEFLKLTQDTSLSLSADDQCWGVATSGWRGRSQSLGIADSVTVIARDAGSADVAATLIANRVSLGERTPLHPEIVQKPACEVKDQSDLGDLLVTTAVGSLNNIEIASALDSGARYAQRLLERGWIQGAVLCLKAQRRICGGFLPSVHAEIHDELRGLVQVSSTARDDQA